MTDGHEITLLGRYPKNQIREKQVSSQLPFRKQQVKPLDVGLVRFAVFGD